MIKIPPQKLCAIQSYPVFQEYYSYYILTLCARAGIACCCTLASFAVWPQLLTVLQLLLRYSVEIYTEAQVHVSCKNYGLLWYMYT